MEVVDDMIRVYGRATPLDERCSTFRLGLDRLESLYGEPRLGVVSHDCTRSDAHHEDLASVGGGLSFGKRIEHARLDSREHPAGRGKCRRCVPDSVTRVAHEHVGVIGIRAVLRRHDRIDIPAPNERAGVHSTNAAHRDDHIDPPELRGMAVLAQTSAAHDRWHPRSLRPPCAAVRRRERYCPR